MASQIGQDGVQSAERLADEIVPRRKWLIAFYKHLLEFERGALQLNEFCRRMQRSVDEIGTEWSEVGDVVQLVRNEEFYIARYESGKAIWSGK
jgi:hypothetical protein